MVLKVFTDQEAAVTTKPEKTGSRVVRWFKTVTPKRKTPYRWYEVDHCGM